MSLWLSKRFICFLTRWRLLHDVAQSLHDEEFLSEEDLDLATLSDEELLLYWNQWLQQAQITNEDDADGYSHGVFVSLKELPLWLD